MFLYDINTCNQYLQIKNFQIKYPKVPRVKNITCMHPTLQKYEWRILNGWWFELSHEQSFDYHVPPLLSGFTTSPYGCWKGKNLFGQYNFNINITCSDYYRTQPTP